MRDVPWVLACGVVAAGVGCGSDDNNHRDAGLADAPRAIDAAIDAVPDAPCDQVVLTGGMDVAAQGWTIVMSPPATITYGADYTELATSTTNGSGGQLLLTRPGSVTSGQPFKLQVVMQVVSISPHNPDPLDAAVAIMGSLTGSFGDTTERSEMVSIEANQLGWADGTTTAAVSSIDSAYHAFVLAVDAAGVATLSRDGTVLVERKDKQGNPIAFVTNGTIAVGDQTNDTGFDATTRIQSVTLLCTR